MQQRFAPLFIILAGSCWGAQGIFVRFFNEFPVYF
jgi:hypothetical protein